MNIVDLSNETKHAVYSRQNGMCAFTGKKFEEFNENIDATFVAIDGPGSDLNNTDNIVMLWKQHDISPKTQLRRYLFSYANFTNYDAEQKFNDFKSDVEAINSVATTAPDIRSVRNTINELTNNIKLLGVSASQRGELKTMLYSALSVINQRQSEVLEKDKEEWKTNYESIKEKINSTIEIAKNEPMFRNGREKLFEVQKEFRELKLSTEHRVELEKLLNSEIKTLTDKIRNWNENFQMECIENYYNLRNLADEAVQRSFSFETYNEAKDALIDVQNKIKDKSRTLQKNQKDELFGYIRSSFEKLAEKFTEYKRVTDEEAAACYAEVKPKVDAALEFARNVNDSTAREARDKLIETQNLIKEARLQRGQKDEIFKAIREVFVKVDEMSAEERKKFEEEAGLNYNTMLSKIELVIVDIENSLDFRTSSTELAAIFAELKLAKLKREQQNKLFTKIRYAFDLLSQKRNEYDKRKYSEKRNRLTGILEEIQQKQAQVTQLLKKDQEILNTQQEKLNSTSEDNNTLKEKYAKIIEEINVRIKDREANLARIQKRIEKLEEDIKQTSELEAKALKPRDKRNRDTNEKETNQTENNSENEQTEQENN